MVDEEHFQAKPLLGFRLDPNPTSPTTPILTMRTVDGLAGYLVTADILRQIGRFLLDAAVHAPKKSDLS